MSRIKSHLASALGAFAVLALLNIPSFAAPPAEKSSSQPAHEQHQTKQEPTLQEQLVELRAKIARLEAALEMNHQGESHRDATQNSESHTAQATSQPHTQNEEGMSMGMEGMSMGMGNMQKMKGMGKMGKMGGMKGMKRMGGKSMMKDMDAPGEKGSMSDPSSTMSMGMDMGRMKRMRMMGSIERGPEPQRASILSSLPGFPGVSHIYHIGASEHFLDLANSLELTMEQRTQLAKHHQESMLRQNDFEREIEKAEQELWVLTSAGEPDAKAIREKVREIGMTQAKMRMAFIESVGSSAKLLTERQQQSLIGEAEESGDPQGEQ